jgi:dTDP-4-dehydrorhamnose 3,5-epimerase-like enzyme
MSVSNYSEDLYENRELTVRETSIPGLLVVHQVLNVDGRGWMKEAFQRTALVPLGLPESFDPVGNQVASLRQRGFTRGIHADTVNKFITVTRGQVFAAIVDLRDGPTFGRLETITLTPSVGIYLPKGCGNSYQALSDDVQYTYLEDQRTSTAPSTNVKLDDPDLAVAWPIPLSEASMLDDDRDRPALPDVIPVKA